MPATDVDFEREFEELVRDLRALPTAAPAGVRERVRALGEPARPRTLHDLLLTLSWRRSLLVLAPVCVLALVSAAVIHGVVNSGGRIQAAVQHAAAEARCTRVSAAPSTPMQLRPLRLGRDWRPGALVADAGRRPLSGLRSLADRSRQGRRRAPRPDGGGDAARADVRRLRRLGRRIDQRRQRPVRSRAAHPGERVSKTRTSGSPSSAR